MTLRAMKKVHGPQCGSDSTPGWPGSLTDAGPSSVGDVVGGKWQMVQKSSFTFGSREWIVFSILGKNILFPLLDDCFSSLSKKQVI